MSKSRDAFRTISEVSDVLDTPAHVLRFWESKFSQIKPVKRAGGRRYYRPTDVDLLAGIKQLLHDDGMTIKGAQKLLREQGVKKIAAMGADQLDRDAPPKIEAPAPEAVTPEATEPTPQAAPPEVEAPETSTEIAASTTQDAPAPIKAPADPDLDIGITNVVPLGAQAPAPEGPRLSLNLSAKPETPADTPPAQNPADILAAIPADPADSDDKSPARLFHLLHKAPHDKLAAQAGAIAPLLAQMRTLRDRIQTR